MKKLIVFDLGGTLAESKSSLDAERVTLRAALKQAGCEGLGFLGLELEESRNATHAAVISTDTSRVTVRVIRTNEELMIARSVHRLLNSSY